MNIEKYKEMHLLLLKTMSEISDEEIELNYIIGDHWEYIKNSMLVKNLLKKDFLNVFPCVGLECKNCILHVDTSYKKSGCFYVEYSRRPSQKEAINFYNKVKNGNI